MPDLFRREALEAKSNAFLGTTVLRPPFSFAAWAAISAVLASVLVTFLILGEYTKRTRVVGITAPDSGVIKLMAPQTGIVIDRRVKEGQAVTAGDILFVLSAERMTASGTNAAGAQSAMLEQLRLRRDSLRDEIVRQRALVQEQSAQMARRLADLRLEAEQSQREIGTLQTRLASSEKQTSRLEDLARQGFMSELAVQQKREEALDQQSRLQALQRNRFALEREAASLAADLRQLPLKGEQQLAELGRNVALIEQEIAGTEANREIVITAPQNGSVTAILAEQGQMVGNQPLLTLLPTDAALEAHLFAPSKAVGFVEPGQHVRVRYAAYPYQKFGQYEGTVTQVSRSALAGNELPLQLAALAEQAGAQGFYKITVALTQASVTAYGKPQPLTVGMQLEADVLQDTRSLIEWVFEPLVSLRGKI
ncbi:MAG: HlyD family efflux transporter periplasmic adaptor subunit [Burkholderiaceae bacterium]